MLTLPVEVNKGDLIAQELIYRVSTTAHRQISLESYLGLCETSQHTIGQGLATTGPRAISDPPLRLLIRPPQAKIHFISLSNKPANLPKSGLLVTSVDQRFAIHRHKDSRRLQRAPETEDNTER